jgi:polysaccharide pyruvyl transferase WcaK-like protein
MRIGGLDDTAVDADTGKLREAVDLSLRARQESQAKCPRIVLLTPYTGGNLGDAAIQDAIIGNLQLRLPGVQFSGLSLNNDNFVERHGTNAFALCKSDGRFYRMYSGRVTDEERLSRPSGEKCLNVTSLKRALKQAPVLGWCLKAIYSFGRRVYREILHCAGGYSFLRGQDLLIVSGGGQLDEEWGGPWGHPFTLAKWAVLARIARVPYAVASVGACKITSTLSRLFVSAALGMARYRSYREKKSREVAAGLLRRAARDSVVPDMAFSLPSSKFPPTAGIRSNSQQRKVVAVSPIAYAKPGQWPCQDRSLHERYLQQMVGVVSHLLEREYFLVFVWSSVGDDDRVVSEIVARLDDESKQRASRQMHIPTIKAWQDLVSSLEDVDILIASRLHSMILGFVTRTPIVAISFDPKVDWVMDDLCLADYLLDIHDFTSEDVIEALYRIELHRDVVAKQIASYLQSIRWISNLQYDTLADLAMASQRCRA